MTRTQLISLCLITGLLGTVFFAYQCEWLIVRSPQIGTTRSNQVKIKKNITIHFWHDDRWHSEKQDLLWSNDTADNLYYLITNWLNTLDTEEITSKKVALQTATISPSGTDAYLSFDHNPLQPEWSTFQKWMWIEGILKTVRDQRLPIQNLYILVHHKPLIDRHLATNNAWPISGFIALNENQLQ